MSGRMVINQRGARTRSRRRPASAAHSSTSDAEASSATSPPISHSLEASVLVLNRLYMAVHVVGVRRAFALLYRDCAEVIHLEEGPRQETIFANYDFDTWRQMSELRADLKKPHDDWIRAVNFEIQVPRVIRLLAFDRIPRQHVHLNRRTLLARDGHVCQYCGRRLPVSQLSIDHVIPRSRGGATNWENVVCACLKCNLRKGGRTPQEASMRLIHHPVRPKRNPMLKLKLDNPKYAMWRTWLEGLSWDVGDSCH